MTQPKIKKAALEVGTDANDIVALDSLGRLPAVDGSLLTNLPGGGAVSSVNGQTGVVSLSLNDLADVDTSGVTDGDILQFSSGSPTGWISAPAPGGEVTNPFVLEFVDPNISYKNVGAGITSFVTGESVGSTDGSGNFVGALDNPVIKPGFTIIYNGANTFYDNGDGTITGDVQGTGTIDYITGAITLTGGEASTALTSDYEWFSNPNNDQNWTVGVNNLTYAVRTVNDAEDTAIDIFRVTREPGAVHANNATFTLHGSTPSFGINMASGQSFGIDPNGLVWGGISPFGIGTYVGMGAFLVAPDSSTATVNAGAPVGPEEQGYDVTLDATDAIGSASDGGNVNLNAGDGAGTGIQGRIVMDETRWGFHRSNGDLNILALTSSNTFTGTALTIQDRSGLPSPPLWTWKGVTRLEEPLALAAVTAGTDEKFWSIRAGSGGTLSFTTATDASPYGVSSTFLLVDRTGLDTDVILSPSLALTLQTDATTRLQIDVDGAWNIDSTPGTAGQVLTSNGSGATPTWEDVGSSSLITQNIQNANYTFAASDNGKAVTQTDDNVWTWTIPLNATVPIPVGTVFSISSLDITGNGSITIGVEGGVTVYENATGVNTGTFGFAGFTANTLQKVGTDLWMIGGPGIQISV